MLGSISDLPASTLTYSLATDTEALKFALASEQVALDIGLDSYRASLFRLACSEIGTNAVRHGKGGVAWLRLSDNACGVIAEFQDNGPGIANLDQAQRDGFSSFGTLGLGLGVAKRSVERFSIQTDERGTSVRLEQYCKTSRNIADHAQWCFPASNETACTADVRIRDFGGDGLLIEMISSRTKTPCVIKNSIEPFRPLETFLQQHNQTHKPAHCDLGLVCFQNGKISTLIQGELALYVNYKGSWTKNNDPQFAEQIILTSTHLPREILDNLPTALSAYDIGRHIFSIIESTHETTAIAVATFSQIPCSTQTFSYASN